MSCIIGQMEIIILQASLHHGHKHQFELWVILLFLQMEALFELPIILESMKSYISKMIELDLSALPLSIPPRSIQLLR